MTTQTQVVKIDPSIAIGLFVVRRRGVTVGTVKTVSQADGLSGWLAERKDGEQSRFDDGASLRAFRFVSRR